MEFDPAGMKAMLGRAAGRMTRRPWMQLLASVLTLAGGRAELLRHAERPWTSVTFNGARHTIALRFPGAAGIIDGEMFIAALPDHEFSLSRHIVVEATVASADHQLSPEPELTVEIDLLLLEED